LRDAGCDGDRAGRRFRDEEAVTVEIPRRRGAGGSSEAEIIVGDEPVIMTYDPDHLIAHAADFTISWSELLRAIGDALDHAPFRDGDVHEGFAQSGVVGVTGVVTVEPHDAAFWGYRAGRSTPSHLVVGEKAATHELCVWGSWSASNRFDLLTCYPGAPAPREIHDPEIGLDEIDDAIAFWSVRAIVVDG
jgi:hypothetical protein